MSLRVIGYSNGRRITVDDGPAHARVQGVGGSALGYFSGTTLTAKQRHKSERRMEQQREASKRYRDRMRP